MKRQVVFIHGGEPFDTHEDYISFLKERQVEYEDFFKTSWSKNLQENLGDKFEVITLQMPCKQNARYAEWKIWFEKVVPFLRDGVILVGHSLGAIFLAKFLSEETFPQSIAGTLLVAPPFDDKYSKYSLSDFKLPRDLSQFGKQSPHITIYHSEDDPIVPFDDMLQYKEALPSIETRVFKDRQHFNQEEFPEIIEEIESLAKV